VFRIVVILAWTDVAVCEHSVVVDYTVQSLYPVVVVLPPIAFGFGRCLPLADRRDKALLKLTPRVMAEFRQRERQPECSALPFVFELGCGLVGGAGLVQPHDTGPACATPIIDSVVTRSINISSVKSSVPAGLSGMTNHRE
jgi:hypothetical protein